MALFYQRFMVKYTDTMNELKQHLLEALKHNLFLKESVRQDVVRKLPELSDVQVKRLQSLLDKANQNQEETLQRILEREPYFFHRIEQTILHTMRDEFNRLSSEELAQAEQQLIQDLAHYNQ